MNILNCWWRSLVLVVCLAFVVHCGHEVNEGQQQEEIIHEANKSQQQQEKEVIHEVNNIQEEEVIHEVNKNQQQQEQHIKDQLKERQVNNGRPKEPEVIKEQEDVPEVDLDVEEEIIAEEEEDAWWLEEITNMDDVEEAWVCSRISPKEVFHTDVHLRLLHILDEMSHMVEAMLAKMEDSLRDLLPHVDQSPIGSLRVDDLFPELRNFMFGTMRDVYDVVRVAWRELIRVHSQAAPTQAPPHVILTPLTNVREAQKEGERRLMASLQEMSITLKAVVFNSVYVTGMSLNLPNNTDDHEAAIAISRTIPKIAPNLLGRLMKRILEIGSDPSAYKKILSDPLRSITPQVDQMYATLETIIENDGGAESMEDYWSEAVRASHRGVREHPIVDEDFYLVFQNEEHLSELILQFMASF